MSYKPARALLHLLLSRTDQGQLIVEENGVIRQYGRPGGAQPLRTSITVHDPRFHRSILKGSRGMGESYMAGLWDVDDLVVLIRIGARNMHRFDHVRKMVRPIMAPIQHLRGSACRNTIKRSRAQIAAHYDLGNQLYELFLDDTMMYSAAIFETPETSLFDAQVAKLDRICQKLGLKPGERLLEIGGGWGGLAIHAAHEYGVHVTTTTISEAQHAHAVERVSAAGLEDEITVLRQDYRALTGTYDKLVCVEMIEAVGWRDFPTFFRVCGQRLTDDGVMLLQAITIDHRAYDVEKATGTFIKRTMFPGGCVPSFEIISRNVVRQSDMRIVQLEDITGHYVTTLGRWREAFEAATKDLEARGYDERFRRLWRLYFAYCEAGFVERRIQAVQVLIAKPDYRDEPVSAVPRRGTTSSRSGSCQDAAPGPAMVNVIWPPEHDRKPGTVTLEQ